MCLTYLRIFDIRACWMSSKQSVSMGVNPWLVKNFAKNTVFHICRKDCH